MADLAEFTRFIACQVVGARPHLNEVTRRKERMSQIFPFLEYNRGEVHCCCIESQFKSERLYFEKKRTLVYFLPTTV